MKNNETDGESADGRGNGFDKIQTRGSISL